MGNIFFHTGVTNKMQKYFNVSLEFDHPRLKHVIESHILENKKGYVCIVDANVLTIAQKNSNYCEILNNSIINSCDGSSIALLAGIIHKKKFTALNGPDLFSYYIEKNYKQLLLGSDDDTSNKIKTKLKTKGFDDSNISVLSLPFMAVADFDYFEIAKSVNKLKPDIIWVSLGAPKQEFFMNKILPYINHGIMFGIGAAFNFYIGKIALPTIKVGRMKFIWLSRILSEPKKQLSRIIPYILLLPRLYMTEKKVLNRKGND
jgi:N-acetylglucosaminyldiphosphoundecaprenol N-acetyl-beta-D-mannosaminyltransferase